MSQHTLGAIAGCSKGTIRNCEISNDSKIYSDFPCSAGGICGYSHIITNCINRASLDIKNGGDAGGIAGDAGSMNKCEVMRCVNFGNISAGDAGGIVGETSEPAKISECCNYGNINSDGLASGITSGCEDKEIINCYNAGMISIDIADPVVTCAGGICRWFFETDKLKNVYNYGTVTASKTNSSAEIAAYIIGGSDDSASNPLHTFCLADLSDYDEDRAEDVLPAGI